MTGVAALFITDNDGRVQLLGETQAGNVVARVARALLEEGNSPHQSRDKEFRKTCAARTRVLARIAMGGEG